MLRSVQKSLQLVTYDFYGNICSNVYGMHVAYGTRFQNKLSEACWSTPLQLNNWGK